MISSSHPVVIGYAYAPGLDSLMIQEITAALVERGDTNDHDVREIRYDDEPGRPALGVLAEELATHATARTTIVVRALADLGDTEADVLRARDMLAGYKIDLVGPWQI